MGFAKSLGFTALGACLVSYASHELGTPGLEDLAYELYDSIFYDHSIGEALSTIFTHIGHYTPDMFYDKESFAGAAGYASMYGGLAATVINAVKSIKKP
ncbi:MAG: hypothetical protein KKA79_02745 [Nanoarchaeota archaeon]|nr:hypothetical protein [Nanoarchaeota archaeon]MCG2718644.1 hypothetical protein [Nanoarchaeota archaeon]